MTQIPSSISPNEILRGEKSTTKSAGEDIHQDVYQKCDCRGYSKSPSILFGKVSGEQGSTEEAVSYTALFSGRCVETNSR